jgi:hypothetical protein
MKDVEHIDGVPFGMMFWTLVWRESLQFWMTGDNILARAWQPGDSL